MEENLMKKKKRWGKRKYLSLSPLQAAHVELGTFCGQLQLHDKKNVINLCCMHCPYENLQHPLLKKKPIGVT